LLARRWAIAVGAFYSTIIIVIVAGVLARGTPASTEVTSAVANSGRNVGLQHDACPTDTQKPAGSER
jgi:hypothetical protein